MKILLLATLALALVCSGLAWLSTIWAIVEFILYLVENKEFNWWGAWCIIIFASVAFISGLLGIVKQSIEVDKSDPNPYPQSKSRFQQKLDEMRERNKKSE